MELILSKVTVKGDFVDQWMLTYVPAQIEVDDTTLVNIFFCVQMTFQCNSQL